MKRQLFLVWLILFIFLLSGCPPGDEREGESVSNGGEGEVDDEMLGKNSVELGNYSHYALTELYIIPVGSSADEWGDNYLPDSIYPEERYAITDIYDGCYDLILVNEIGYSAYAYDVCLYDNIKYYWDIYDAK